MASLLGNSDRAAEGSKNELLNVSKVAPLSTYRTGRDDGQQLHEIYLFSMLVFILAKLSWNVEEICR